MKDANSELMRLASEIEQYKQHAKETKRLIKMCFAGNKEDEYKYTHFDYHDTLMTHVNKRKIIN